MSVLDEILEWSLDRPLWQRDALRRIVTRSELKGNDQVDLLNICLSEHGIPTLTGPPRAVPLSAEHIRPRTGADERVQLIGLREISGVNALAADQSMSFSLDGLTVIYGQNGSGKSGYARILRSLCHSRIQKTDLLPNAFDGPSTSPPSVVVDYRVGGSNYTKMWSDGMPPPIELGRISFFDSGCAFVHVVDENELGFTPFGLDVLPRLVLECESVKASISAQIEDQKRIRPAHISAPPIPEHTQTYRDVRGIGPSDEFAKFRASSDLAQHEIERMGELEEALGIDPKKRAAELHSAARRLFQLTARIESCERELSQAKIAEYEKALSEAIRRDELANIAASRMFEDSPLEGVGEDVWIELWEVARRYSCEVAYPLSEFPNYEDGARCILCQQPLLEEGVRRFQKFESFVKNDTRSAAIEARRTVANHRQNLEALCTGFNAYENEITDISPEDGTLRKDVRRYLRIAWKVRERTLESLRGAEWSPPCDLGSSPRHQVVQKHEALVRRASELEAACDDVKRQELKEELAELRGRQWLGTVLHDVEGEIERAKTIQALAAALTETVTTGITRFSSTLTEKYVTDALCMKFIDEVAALGGPATRVDLTSVGGRRGQRRFRVGLKGARGTPPIQHVLSEGEFRTIALAAFLAELSTEDSNSALVFDDPVSSLDHKWRRRVAERLVQEAAVRQIVIFTHDIVFLHEILAAADVKRLERVQINQVRVESVGPGVCLDGEPWIAMKVSKRLGLIRNKLQHASAVFNKVGPDAYEPVAREIYGLLREAWERAVEETLLNGVIVRFGIAIQTQRLKKIPDITDSDIDMIVNGMTKASRFLRGHDEPASVNESVPNPDEIEGDVKLLADFVSAINKRRN